MQATISKKSILRLSIYRRHLRALEADGEEYIYSHQLARLTGCTASQIRRDLMQAEAVGCSAKGYNVRQLLQRLNSFLDGEEQTQVVLFGAGRLGKAMLQFFLNNRPNLKIVAAFETDPDKTDRVICGVHCYHVSKANQIIARHDATVAIVTAPASAIDEISLIIGNSGIRGVLNFAPTTLLLPKGVEERHVDITSQLEALACMVRQS